MKLSEIQLPISYEFAKNYALIFSSILAQQLSELYNMYGSTNLVPMPIELVDGRFMLCADILTECNPGGLLWNMWTQIDPIILDQVDVISMEEALLLLQE